MTTDAPTTLRTCPDCGGILEPTRPEYLLRLDADTAVRGELGGPTAWQCFICGYHEGVAERGLSAEV